MADKVTNIGRSALRILFMFPLVCRCSVKQPSFKVLIFLSTLSEMSPFFSVK